MIGMTTGMMTFLKPIMAVIRETLQQVGEAIATLVVLLMSTWQD
jgi:hypothetical protein